MNLDVRGRPLHTRDLDVEVHAAADRCWQVRGELVDVRKAGFVPIAGDLQMAGLLHHMRIDARVDPASGRIEVIEAAQPRVAFEASALSRGESCRDPVRRIEALCGTPLDAGFTRRLSDAIGGPRGCSHVLALGRLLGSTLIRARARERERPRDWRAGERLLRRALAIDASQAAAGELALALQLTDVDLAPAPEQPRPMERLERMVEVRARAVVELGEGGLRALGGAALRELELAVRDRSRDYLADPRWQTLEEARGLAGLPLLGPITARVLAAFGDRPAGDPVVDLLLQLAPGVLQAASSSLGEAWPALAARSASRIVCAGPPDSCYMWRRGGALDQARLAEPAPALGEGEGEQ